MPTIHYHLIFSSIVILLSNSCILTSTIRGYQITFGRTPQDSDLRKLIGKQQMREGLMQAARSTSPAPSNTQPPDKKNQQESALQRVLTIKQMKLHDRP